MTLRHPDFLPRLVLLLALASIFAVQTRESSFLPGHHGFLTSHGLALAANLSPEHYFLMFTQQHRNENGSTEFDAYNRFSALPFALVRIGIAPFAGDPHRQLLAARTLMNMFFAGALLLAWLSLRRLFNDEVVACSAVLLAFASPYFLYYSDVVFNTIPALFGVLLVFHGMVVYEQEKRLPQLQVKVLLGVLLGWQVLAWLLPFVAVSAWRDHNLRYLFLLALALSVSVIGLNLVNESLATGKSLMELPSLQSMLRRFGMNATAKDLLHQDALSLNAFARRELYRIGQLFLPAAVSTPAPVLMKVLGLLALAAALLSAYRLPRRALALVLLLSGFCWSIPLRNYVSYHHFEAMYYIGLPLLVYGALFQWLGNASRKALALSAGIVLLVFLFSAQQMREEKQQQRQTRHSEQRLQEFAAMNLERLGGRTVYVEGELQQVGGARHALGFYLAGSFLVSEPDRADFIVSLQDGRAVLRSGRESSPPAP